ncbi:MAG TPA: type VI secretion system lipoprotein TssJ, partial [Aliidongia sp.]|uniref:type VI secretion system lipoprotein TssJ n=1 Tax=Aliidongia sp. TaxID=1914230 RepID=UPI002DDCD8EA
GKMVASMQRTLTRLLAGTAAVTLAACASPPPPPPPTKVVLSITSTATVNPGADGTPAPVMLRIYQLGAAGTFEKADFFQLNDKDQALLGPDLLGKDQAVLTPGGSQKMEFEVKPGTRFIGVTAAYRDIDHAVWRADVPVPPNATTNIAVNADKLKLSATAGGQ